MSNIISSGRRDYKKELEGKVIKHFVNSDLAYWVKTVIELGKNIIVRVEMLGIGYEDTYFLDEELFNITIKKDDLDDWHVCIDDNQRCLRYVAWKALGE
jgi:hypothetical protein